MKTNDGLYVISEKPTIHSKHTGMLNITRNPMIGSFVAVLVYVALALLASTARSQRASAAGKPIIFPILLNYRIPLGGWIAVRLSCGSRKFTIGGLILLVCSLH